MAMKITAPDLMALKIVDRIIAEPLGGAHADRHAAITAVGDVLADELHTLSDLDPATVRARRAERFYAIGRMG
jgi:acetyl-CoA carboxylase carboxyl transferase subunit alpha